MYKSDRHTESSIIKILYDWQDTKKFPRSSNIYMYGGKTKRWESDFVFIDDLGMIWDIDVKCDRQDAQREFTKKIVKHELLKEAYDSNNESKYFLPNYFYLCAPEEILPIPNLPDYVGVISITQDNHVVYETSVTQIHDYVDRGLNFENFTKKIVKQRMKDEIKILDFIVQMDKCGTEACYKKTFDRFKKSKRV